MVVDSGLLNVVVPVSDRQLLARCRPVVVPTQPEGTTHARKHQAPRLQAAPPWVVPPPALLYHAH